MANVIMWQAFVSLVYGKSDEGNQNDNAHIQITTQAGTGVLAVLATRSIIVEMANKIKNAMR